MNSAVPTSVVLSSAIIVLGGLVALVRAVWRLAQALRDNASATAANTEQLTRFAARYRKRTKAVDQRFGKVERRVARLERK